MMSAFSSIDEVEYRYKSISVDEEASLPIKLKIIEEDNAWQAPGLSSPYSTDRSSGLSRGVAPTY